MREFRCEAHGAFYFVCVLIDGDLHGRVLFKHPKRINEAKRGFPQSLEFVHMTDKLKDFMNLHSRSDHLLECGVAPRQGRKRARTNSPDNEPSTTTTVGVAAEPILSPAGEVRSAEVAPAQFPVFDSQAYRMNSNVRIYIRKIAGCALELHVC